jgi:hypothetical protein
MEGKREMKTIFSIILPSITSAVLAFVFAVVLERRREKRNLSKEKQKSAEEKKIVELEQFYEKLQIFLDATHNGFKNQIEIRKRLIENIQKRFDISSFEREKSKALYHWDDLFEYIYPQLNKDEKDNFIFIRGITENTLYTYNRKIVELLDSFPQFHKDVPEIGQLFDHLNFWLSKYNSVFQNREDMCLVYVGLEDNKPFPKQVDKLIPQKISELKAKLNES